MPVMRLSLNGSAGWLLGFASDRAGPRVGIGDSERESSWEGTKTPASEMRSAIVFSFRTPLGNLEPRFASNRLAPLPSRALLRDLVSLERLGFLCCIPNVMELVANGVPFLWLARAREDAKVAHGPSAIENYFWPTMVVTGDGELGFDSEREPEKRLPHPRKAAAQEITQSRHGRISVLFAFWIGVMINRTGHSDFIVENESGAQDDRYRPSLNYKRCRTVDRRMLLIGLTAPYEKSKSWVPGSMVARLKLKGIDGRAPLEWSLALNLTQHGKLTSPHIVRIDRPRALLDSMGGGAWPLLVGGAICPLIPLI
ncbi:hypothetical protein FNV43_RR21516 [Rhamnella rubrinervis]|uniref:Uncharacterized protein n=1 Tax=Rhamnella rubrinervis TaxID=2594499 RepID=A0A8K0DWC1_9ROSA|nr:hypothetical protein FNV43_RR21516 [Rhamnella rubrinervis]